MALRTLGRILKYRSCHVLLGGVKPYYDDTEDEKRTLSLVFLGHFHRFTPTSHPPDTHDTDMSTTGVMRQIDSPNSSSSSSSGGISGGGSGNAPADDSPDVEVRKADQEMINEFGRLNNKYIELDEDLTGLKVRAMMWEKIGSRALGSLRCFSAFVQGSGGPPFCY